MKSGPVLITGASSGLGAEFAQQLARSHHDLILVARDAGRLEAKAARLRADFGVKVELLPADLLTDDGVASVCARLADRARPISMLVNNAGYGMAKPFEENSAQEERDLLRILVRTPMELMHAALAPMLANGDGLIINVASVAGFIPRGSYGAAKAWGISFSRFANLRYGPRGVNVTAVCPGFVHTEFHERMGVAKARGPKWMWLNPDQVVREALADSAAGKSVSIPSHRYSVMVALSRLVPDKVSAAIANGGR